MAIHIRMLSSGAKRCDSKQLLIGIANNKPNDLSLLQIKSSTMKQFLLLFCAIAICSCNKKNTGAAIPAATTAIDTSGNNTDTFSGILSHSYSSYDERSEERFDTSAVLQSSVYINYSDPDSITIYDNFINSGLRFPDSGGITPEFYGSGLVVFTFPRNDSAIYHFSKMQLRLSITDDSLKYDYSYDPFYANLKGGFSSYRNGHFRGRLNRH